MSITDEDRKIYQSEDLHIFRNRDGDKIVFLCPKEEVAIHMTPQEARLVARALLHI
jgi:hypothetical protein